MLCQQNPASAHRLWLDEMSAYLRVVILRWRKIDIQPHIALLAVLEIPYQHARNADAVVWVEHVMVKQLQIQLLRIRRHLQSTVCGQYIKLECESMQYQA